MSFGGLDNTQFGGSYLGSMPWHQANTTINLNDNLTWVHNRHTFKFGAFYQRNRKDQIAWGNINGQFSFDVGPTGSGTCPANARCGDPYASALLGDFNSFSQSTARPLGKFRYNQLEFYVQDTWKVTDRLTLDYGMRFAWIPPQYDANNQIALFDPAAYNASQAVQSIPMEISFRAAAILWKACVTSAITLFPKVVGTIAESCPNRASVSPMTCSETTGRFCVAEPA